jgi:hypothetical protein
MAGLTKAQLRIEIQGNLGNRTDIDTRIDTWLELSQQYVATHHDFREMMFLDEVTIVPVNDPAVDKLYSHGISNLKEIYTLLRQVGTEFAVKLTSVPNRQWQQLLGKPDTGTTGDAVWYTLFGSDTIELSPVPNRTYKLQRFYSKWPSVFASDSAVSDFEQKDELLIARTTYQAFQSLGMREDAAHWFAVSENLLKSTTDDDRYRSDTTFIARGISEAAPAEFGEPWADPFVRSTSVE